MTEQAEGQAWRDSSNGPWRWFDDEDGVSREEYATADYLNSLERKAAGLEKALRDARAVLVGEKDKRLTIAGLVKRIEAALEANTASLEGQAGQGA